MVSLNSLFQNIPEKLKMNRNTPPNKHPIAPVEMQPTQEDRGTSSGNAFNRRINESDPEIIIQQEASQGSGQTSSLAHNTGTTDIPLTPLMADNQGDYQLLSFAGLPVVQELDPEPFHDAEMEIDQRVQEISSLLENLGYHENSIENAAEITSINDINILKDTMIYQMNIEIYHTRIILAALNKETSRKRPTPKTIKEHKNREAKAKYQLNPETFTSAIDPAKIKEENEIINKLKQRNISSPIFDTLTIGLNFTDPNANLFEKERTIYVGHTIADLTGTIPECIDNLKNIKGDQQHLDFVYTQWLPATILIDKEKSLTMFSQICSMLKLGGIAHIKFGTCFAASYTNSRFTRDVLVPAGFIYENVVNFSIRHSESAHRLAQIQGEWWRNFGQPLENGINRVSLLARKLSV